MRISMLLATLVLIAMLTASAENPMSPGESQQQQAATSSGATTLTGCLKGSKNQYYLVEQGGTRHTLMGKNEELSSYVNHKVTVTGKPDTSRQSAGSSDAEGHRKGFFSVDSVSDQGACKK
jgi:hypothetical protein